jgi:hypothetical protein
LDSAALRSTGETLRLVAKAFDAGATSAHDVAGAVGHPVLAGAVRGFEGSWDHTRADMVMSIGQLADACTGIGDSFVDLDTQLAAALRAEG